MRCQVCGEGEALEGDTCPYCGAMVQSILGRGAPLPPEIVAEAEERRRALTLRREARLRERAKRHAVVGGLIFAVFGFVLAGAAFSSVVVFLCMEALLESKVGVRALAASQEEAVLASAPLSVLFGLALAFVLAAALGAPAGYVVSYLNRGQVLGALVGVGAFSLSSVLGNLGNILGSGSPWHLLALCAVIAALPGGTAGYVLGWHISWDE